MHKVVFELDLKGRKPVAIEHALDATPPPNLLFDALATWWAQRVAQPYLKLTSARQVRPITVPWPFLGKTATLTTTFDLNLLGQSLQIYARCGWSALEDLARRLNDNDNVSGETRDFFRITTNVVAVMVAAALVEVEQRCLLYAQGEWAAASKKLHSYLKDFVSTKDRGGSLGFKDPRVVDRLFGQCRDFKVVSDKALALGRKREDRNTRTPANERPSGSGNEKWFELFAGPERGLLKKMAGILKDVAGTYPPAVLVLHELPDSLTSGQTPNQVNVAKSDLGLLIHARLAVLLGELEALEATAKRPGATFHLAALLQPMLDDPRDLSRVTTLRVPPGGFEQTVLDLALKGAEEFAVDRPVGKVDLLRVLADPDLLSRFYDDEDAVVRSVWGQRVLDNYRVRLSQTISDRERDARSVNAIWNVARRVAAALALIGLLAVFPFGEAVALPPFVALLELAGGAAAVLGILTMLHDTFGTLEAAGQLDAKAQERFFRLGQTDPEGLAEVGRLLSGSQELRSAVTNGGLLLLLTMPVAQLRIATAALNFVGLVQDVEILFGKG